MNRLACSRWSVLALMLGCGAARPLGAQMTAHLKPETVQAFDRYAGRAEAEMDQRRAGKAPFFSIQDAPRMERLRKGEILTQRQAVAEKDEAPSGIIHDWTGTMFIPGASVERVLGVLQDFSQHKQIYAEILDARLIKRDGNRFEFYWRLKKQKVMTVVLNSMLQSQYEPAGSGRWYCRTHSLRIAEVSDPGTAKEAELPVGNDHGFLWRLYAYWFLEGTKDGVMAECRSISLSRDVPRGLGWMINPIIRDLPAESLWNTLDATRRAVLAFSKQRL